MVKSYLALNAQGVPVLVHDVIELIPGAFYVATTANSKGRTIVKLYRDADLAWFVFFPGSESERPLAEVALHKRVVV